MIYGMWHGGPSYAAPYVTEHVETFPSIAAAMMEMRDRIRGWGTFRYADRPVIDNSTPAVTESTMTVWLTDPRDTEDPYPDRMLVQGPHGGVRCDHV